MPSFTYFLEKAIREEWADSYFDYASFKSLLESFALRRSALSNNDVEVRRLFEVRSAPGLHENSSDSTDSGMDSDSAAYIQFPLLNKTVYQKERYLDLIERQELCYVLDNNVRKFAQLFLDRLQLLNQRLDELIEHEKNNFVSQKEIEYSEYESLSAYTTLGDELLELYAFMGANITTFRQALIRYDCLLRAMNGPPLGQWYVVRRRRTISKSKNTEDAALFQAAFSRHGLVKFVHRLDACLRHRELEYLNTLLKQVKGMEGVIQCAERDDRSFKEPRALSDKIFKLQYYLLAGGRLNELMLQPSFIRTRGAKLKKEIKHFADWREKRNEFVYSHEYETRSTSFMSMFTPSLWLTFTSQMLYMMNHYIIEPSSTNVSRCPSILLLSSSDFVMSN